jgi:hypothetical protein
MLASLDGEHVLVIGLGLAFALVSMTVQQRGRVQRERLETMRALASGSLDETTKRQLLAQLGQASDNAAGGLLRFVTLRRTCFIVGWILLAAAGVQWAANDFNPDRPRVIAALLVGGIAVMAFPVALREFERRLDMPRKT